MIELKSAIISSKEAPGDKIDLRFGNGYHELSYNQKFLFDFFKLRNQALQEGYFIIDEKTFFHHGEEKSNRLVTMLVRSQIFAFSVCFIVAPDDVNKIQQIKTKLVASRNRSHEVEEAKSEKIIAIINILKAVSPSYYLFDWNNPVNADNRDMIVNAFPLFSSTAVIIGLQTNPNASSNEDNSKGASDYWEENDEVYEIDVAAGTIEKKRDSMAAKMFDRKDLLQKVLRYNLVSYLLLLISITYTIVFLLVTPYYLSKGSVAFGIFLIAFCLLFSLIACLMATVSFNFIDNAKENRRLLKSIAYVYSYLFTVLAIILGVAIFFLLGINALLFDLKDFRFPQAIGAIVVAIVHLSIPLFYVQLQKIILKIKRFFVKK